MNVRKNVRSLTADEKARFVNAVLELKAAGTYDHFVHAHHHIMLPSVFPNEPRDANYRNPAHRGPGPPGHNLDDQIRPWMRKIQDVLDISKLGYSYEAPEFESATTMVGAEPQLLRRNPFWAD